MIAGAIEIQMMADLARLKKDMDDAKSVVGNAAQSMQNAANMVKSAFGLIGASLSVGAIVKFVDGLIEAAGSLHDLSQQSGASVEALSAFSKIGLTTGTTAETIAGAMNKLAKGLAVSSEESKGAGAALKVFGLNFDTFIKLKPEAQLVALAKAQATFADGSGKSAAMMTLIRGEGAKLIPFLNDLAKAETLAGTVTAQQAKLADDFKDSITELGGSFKAAATGVALDFLPVLIKLGGLFEPALKVAAAYFAAFVAAPAIFSAAAAGFSALTAAMAAGATVSGVLSASMATTIAMTQAMIVEVGLLKLAAGVLIAAFAGWEIGKWLSENFVWARLAGVAFVDGTLTAWEHLKYAGGMLWAAFKDLALGAYEAIGAALSTLLGGIGKGLSFVGLDAMGDAVTGLSVDLREATKSTFDFDAEAANLKAELDRNVTSIHSITDEMADAAIAYGVVETATAKATKTVDFNAEAMARAAAAAKKHADELAKLAEAGAKLVSGALYTDAGLNADFGDKLTQLAAAYNAKKISMEELEAAQARLMAQQPGVIASLKAATDEAKARADARRKESDEIESYMANQEAQRVQTVKAARDAVTSAQLEYDSYGLLKSQIAELALQRLIDKQNAYTAGSANYESVQKEIDAQKELIGILQRGEVRDASVKAAKEAQDTWLNTITTIGSGMADAWMNGVDSLKSYIVGAFKNFFIRIPLQTAMTGITGAIGGALGFAPGMASAADGAGGGGGMLSMLGSVGGSLGALGSFGMTGLMSTLTGTGLGTSLGAAGSLISGGSVAGGIGMGLGAIAPYALAAMLVYKLLTADHDAKLGYGTATMGADGGIGTGGRLLSFGRGADQGSQGQLEQVAQAVMAGISGTALGLGGSAGAGLAVQASTDMDLSGLGAASINLFRSGVRLGGLQTGGSNPLNSDAAKVDQKDIAAWLADNASAAIVLGLQQSDLPAKFRDFFATVDAFALSKAEAEAMLEAANNARRLTDALSPIGGIFATLGNLSVVATTQLAAMVGGMDALIAKSQDFVKNYYSESEQAAISARNILAAATKAGADSGALAGLGGLTDKASFRAMFEGIDPNAAGGLGLAALGLNIQAEFAQLSTYLQSSGLTLGQLAAQAMVPAIVTAVSDAADAAAATAAAEADPLAATADAAAGAAGASAGGASATPADLLQSILTSINALAADLKLAATETGTKQAAQTTVTADGFVQSVAVLTAVAEDVHALLRIQQDEAAAV